MSCFKGNKGKKALVAFSILVLVQLGLIIGLLVLGAKGKQEIGKESGTGVPYYVGAIVVGSVFMVPVLQIIAVIFLSSFEKEYCITGCFVVSSCLFTFFGILACVLGMIFVIAFGIANCKKEPGDYTDIGFCSYATNIDTNYTIAVVSLVLILFMLISTCFSFYIFSKYSDALVSRKQSSIPAASNIAPSNYNRAPSQGPNSNLSTQGQSRYPAPTAPPLYSAHNEGYTDPAYPTNSGLSSTGGTEDPPPSYESVMYNSGTRQATASNQHQTSSYSTSYNPPQSQQRTLTQDTQRRMVQDREIRNDLNRQRRMGVPEHRLIRKFFKK